MGSDKVSYTLDRERRYSRTDALKYHVHCNSQIDEFYALMKISRHSGNHGKIDIRSEWTGCYNSGEFT
jgi:phage terminase large subunit GpA-like protein